jgi:hypothetical protein
MIDRSGPKRVLIVGAGFRAANNFLPSLALMPASFSVVGLVAKSRTRSASLGIVWNVPAYDDLSQVDPKTVDIVVVTVPTHANAAVLAAILKWNDRVDLVIDTPIASTFAQYRELRPLLRKFRAVAVAEDFMNLPHFELALRAARDGLFGTIRSVTLFNTGYRYHGLALLRSFAELGSVVGSKRAKLGSYSSVITYHFAGGMRGHIVGPYRQVTTGGIVVEGDRGVLTQAAEDAQFADVGKRLVYRLAQTSADGLPSAFVIENSSYRLDLPEIAAMKHMPFEDRSWLNVLKNVGLTRIFDSLVSGDGLNASYGFENGLYDSFASKLASAGVFPFDPLVAVGKNFMSLAAMTARTARGGRSLAVRRASSSLKREPIVSARIERS